MKTRRLNVAPALLTANAPAPADATLHLTSTPADLRIEAAAPAQDGKPAKARKFTMTAYTGGSMYVGMFYEPVVVDLDGLDIGNSARPILIDHNTGDIEAVLGQTDKIQIKGSSLIVSGSIYGESDQAKQVIALNDRGFKFQASIGARALNREFVEAGSDVTVNGQLFHGPINVVRKSVLNEVSFVILGADDNTSATIAATHAAKGLAMNFQEWLAANGLSLDNLTDDQKTKLQATFNAQQSQAQQLRTLQAAANNGGGTVAGNSGGNVNGGSGNNNGGNGAGQQQDNRDVRGGAVTPQQRDLDSVLSDVREKESRRQGVVALTAKFLRENPGQLQVIEALSRVAMDGEWTADRYELEMRRELRPGAPNQVRPSDDLAANGINQQVIEAALCLSGGVEKPEKFYSEQTLNAAATKWRNGLGLVELLQIFAKRNGRGDIGQRDISGLLKAAFVEPDYRQVNAAGFSTLSLPNIFSNVANKFLKIGFDGVEQTWRSIAAIRPVKDFKQVSSYSLTGDFQYIEIPPGGDLKHAEAGEVVYTNQAKTYGRLFAIDRRDLINDDLGALTQVPKRLGRGGALKFNDVFWSTFMGAIATLFTTGHANYLSGVTPGTNDSRLNIEGITRAETAFFNQTDPDGKPLGAMARIMLVPNALNATASALMRSTEVRDTTANTQFVTANPHAGKFDIVRSTYLSNAAYTGNSATQWFLLADPNTMAVIEAAFLNGVETPTVESADADFGVLGIQMRGYHDFGVSVQEYRAGVASKGAA